MSTTVRGFLNSVDPNIGYRRTSKNAGHSRIRGPKWPKTMRKWPDFENAILEQMGGGILGRALQEPFDFQHCPQHGGHIREEYNMPDNEAVLEGYLVTSVQRTVSCALSQTQRSLQNKGLLTHIPGPGIQMLRGGQAENIKARDGPHDYQPDWAACPPTQPSKDRYRFQPAKPPAILLGDTKLRWKANFNLLNNALKSSATIDFQEFGQHDAQTDEDSTAPTDPSDDSGYSSEYHGLRQAIIQIYTYCYSVGCRYGYIINETQLFVFRIRPDSDHYIENGNEAEMFKALEDGGLLEFRIISYNVKDHDQLSVNLALWWLHLLAAVDHKIRWQYPPLMEMTLDPASARQLCRKRYMSEEVEPPPYSQVTEDQYFDLRLPALRRRRQLSSKSDPDSDSDPEVIKPPPLKSKLEQQTLPTEDAATPCSKKGTGQKSSGKRVGHKPKRARKQGAAKRQKISCKLSPGVRRPARPPMHRPVDHVSPTDRMKAQQAKELVGKDLTRAKACTADTQSISRLYSAAKPCAATDIQGNHLSNVTPPALRKVAVA